MTMMDNETIEWLSTFAQIRITPTERKTLSLEMIKNSRIQKVEVSFELLADPVAFSHFRETMDIDFGNQQAP